MEPAASSDGPYAPAPEGDTVWPAPVLLPVPPVGPGFWVLDETGPDPRCGLRTAPNRSPDQGGPDPPCPPTFIYRGESRSVLRNSLLSSRLGFRVEELLVVILEEKRRGREVRVEFLLRKEKNR